MSLLQKLQAVSAALPTPTSNAPPTPTPNVTPTPPTLPAPTPTTPATPAPTTPATPAPTPTPPTPPTPQTPCNACDTMSLHRRASMAICPALWFHRHHRCSRRYRSSRCFQAFAIPAGCGAPGFMSHLERLQHHRMMKECCCSLVNVLDEAWRSASSRNPRR